jgi:hypothetical protein
MSILSKKACQRETLKTIEMMGIVIKSKPTLNPNVCRMRICHERFGGDPNFFLWTIAAFFWLH